MTGEVQLMLKGCEDEEFLVTNHTMTKITRPITTNDNNTNAEIVPFPEGVSQNGSLDDSGEVCSMILFCLKQNFIFTKTCENIQVAHGFH